MMKMDQFFKNLADGRISGGKETLVQVITTFKIMIPSPMKLWVKLGWHDSNWLMIGRHMWK
jgi:hypothetical protein